MSPHKKAVKAVGIRTKSRHGRNRAQARNQPIKPIREHPPLNPRIKQLPLHLQPRNITSSSNIPNRLHHEHNIHRQQRQNNRPINRQRERLNPNKTRRGRRIDPGRGKISRSGSDDAANEQAHDDGAGFHDRGAEALAEDDGDEDAEAEADVLGRAPGEGVRGADLGADAVGAAGWAVDAAGGAGAAGPALEAGFD